MTTTESIYQTVTDIAVLALGIAYFIVGSTYLSSLY